jgi:hypothetical protein
MTQRRLASLAVAACAVLLLGLYIRGRLEHADQTPVSAPPSEGSALQQLSHEGLLRRASSFVSERALAVARHVVYVPQAGASGVRWRADSVLSVDAARLIGVTRAPLGAGGAPPVRVLGDSVRSDWVLLVGRSERGTLLSLAGSLGGRARTRCTGREIDELLLNVPLLDHLAGAGMFDLSGSLIGMVVRCGERLAAIPSRQITALLASDSVTADPDAFGLTVSSLDPVGRRYFATDSGALVTAVRRGGAADAAGLRPGDVLLSIDDRSISTPNDLTRAASEPPDSVHSIVRLRGGRRSSVRLGVRGPADTTRRAAPASLGIDLSPSAQAGVAVSRVSPGSAAGTAGVRAGDRITRIGASDVASRSEAERLLRAAAQRPTFIVFERDSVEYGTLVQP